MSQPRPSPDLAALARRLNGTWKLAGGVEGSVTFEPLDGGFFLLQHVDLDSHGVAIKGLEVIGHNKPFQGEPAAEITSRFYGNAGDTLDYVYELDGDILTIWGGEKGSPACCTTTFSADGDAMAGAWVWPGGGYEYTATRVG